MRLNWHRRTAIRQLFHIVPGETEDFIADLAVAVNAGWIKTGARAEESAALPSYNQLRGDQ